MRQLLYIPVIHSEVDLGAPGAALAQRNGPLAGAAHKETVARFWATLGEYLLSLDACKMAVYQDGLPVEGAMGRRIVQQASQKGSENYQLVLKLLERGADLRKTEDPALLVQEYENIVAALGRGPGGQETYSAEDYASERDRLTRQRDEFIAGAIATTLKEGESGVLFIGAYHSVVPLLPDDIVVITLKDPITVRAYMEEVVPGEDDRRLEELRRSLTLPVKIPEVSA